MIRENDMLIDGLRLHYSVSGPEGAQPVILLHGWGCDHTTVKSIADILSGSLRIYNLDIAGHGKSDEPDAVWGIDCFTRQLESFVKNLGISDPVLIGHSFGGRMSILYSSRNPVHKVVLVDAAGIKPRRTIKYYFKVYTYKAAKKTLPLLLGKSISGRAIAAWRGKAGSADYQRASERMRAVMSRCVNEDLRSVMPSIKAPTLLIWGADDTATPLSDARIMERLIPDAGLVAFDGCGHYSFLDNPRGFRAVLLEFLKPEMK